MRCVGLVLLSGALLLLLPGANAAAGPRAPGAAEPKRPESLTANIDDIRIRIDGPKLWTLSGIDYKKTVMAVEESAYGTVLNIRGVGILGSAHFLDVPNKPGEVEKEIVTDVKFLLDNRPLTEITPQMRVSGQSFRMERRSKIRSVELESSVCVRDGVLMESARLRSAKAVDLVVAYPLMYAWTPTATAYLFGDDAGIQKRGTFAPASAKPVEGNEKAARWMAVYDGPSGKGAVCYVVQRPKNVDLSLQFTDAPGIYRKLRLMCFTEKTMPAGFDGTFQTAIGFFTATEKDWEAKAQQRAAELKSQTTTPTKP